MRVRYLTRRAADGVSTTAAPNLQHVIPLPRSWVLTSALLVGTAVGLILAIASSLLVHASIRPDVVVALVVGVPSAVGLLAILMSGRRWVTTLGAFVLAIGPAWFGVLVAIQAVHGV